jgi:hypothetical protein
MFQKSSCDKFLGERFCVHAGTLGYDAWPVIGVTTLGSNGVLCDGLTLIDLCVLNYSHSRNPRCAPAWTHGQIQAPGEPPN